MSARTHGKSPADRAAIAFLVSTAAIGCRSAQSAPKPEPKPVVWAVPTSASAERSLELSARLQRPQQTVVGFDVAGRLAKLHVVEGQTFAKGDILAELEAQKYRLRASLESSRVSQSKALLREAKKNLSRATSLHVHGAAPRSEVDRAQAAFGSLRGQVAVASAGAALAQADLRDTKLRAPYDGQVGQLRAEVAQTLPPGTPVMEVFSHAANLEVVVDVPETLVAQVQTEGFHRLRINALGEGMHRARVTEVAATPGRARTYPVTLEVLDEIPRARAGMSSIVELQLIPAGDQSEGRPATAYRVPITALKATDLETTELLVIDDNSTLRPTPVAVERIENEEAIVRSDALSLESKVVTLGVDFLSPGQAVSPLGGGVARFNP
ncbi:MAG: efflux RND transporter periplasmic adaptor subunit [Myxococcota bacterium]